MDAGTKTQATDLIEKGQLEEARKLLLGIIEKNANDETAWLIMADAVEKREQSVRCLQRVLQINPDNLLAKKRLENLSATVDTDSTTQRNSLVSHSVQTPEVSQIRKKENRKALMGIGIAVGIVGLFLGSIAGINIGAIVFAPTPITAVSVLPSTYTPYPTYTYLPTHKTLPTYTPYPTYTDIPTQKPLPTYTPFSTYTNWAPDEPSNSGGAEDYALMNWDLPGLWNDGQETVSFITKAIIERNEPISNWIFNPKTTHYYKMLPSCSGWHACENAAIAQGAHLVTINDADEQAWLVSTFGYDMFWIGFTDEDHEGDWHWIGEAVDTYTIMPTNTSISTIVPTSPTFTQPPSASTQNIGSIRFDSWSFEISEVRSESGEDPTRKIIVLLGYLTNEGNSNDAIFVVPFLLRDSKGREYESNLDATFNAYDKYDAEMPLSLNPGKTIFTAFAFDVIPDENTFTIVPGQFATSWGENLTFTLP